MENLDDFIKGKLAQDPIEFSEAHWMKAAKMIEGQEFQKRRRFVIWFFFGQMVFALILAFFISFDSNENNDALSLPQANVGSTSTSNSTHNPQQETLTTNNPSPIQTPTTHNPQQETLSTSDPLPIQTPTTHNPQKETLTTNNPLPIQTPTTHNPQQETLTTNNPSPIQTPTTRNPQQETLSTSDPSSIQTPTTRNPQQETLTTNDPSPIQTPTAHNSQQETLTACNPIASLEFPYLDIKNHELDKTTQLYNSKNPSHSTISIAVASSLYPYPQVGAKRLIAYSAGLNYNVSLKKSWSLETAIHYRIRQGHFSNSQTTTQDSFAFRRISTEHFLKTTELHIIEIPLAVSYAKYRHQFQLGLNYARLLGTKGSLNKIEVQETPNNQQIAKGWLEDDSFSTNRFELMLGYYYTLKPGFRVGANLHYTLSGILSNQASSDLYVEYKPLFIDFGVRYDLINR